MINPWRVSRAKGTIVRFYSFGGVAVRLASGYEIDGYPKKLPKGLYLGDSVNIQVRFSIVMDRHVVLTVNRLRGVK